MFHYKEKFYRCLNSKLSSFTKCFKYFNDIRVFDWLETLKGQSHEKVGEISSVADPDHFDADPDPTSEKNRIRIRIRPRKKPDPDPIMLYIKFW
jgi:hypothetical protein